MELVCDNSELNGIWGAEAPDILVIGGYLILIEDMTVRNLSPATQQSYLNAVSKFSQHFGRSPDRLGLEDVHAFQVHLVASGISWPALNQIVCAPRFFYGVTLGQDTVPERIAYAREPSLPPGADGSDITTEAPKRLGLRLRPTRHIWPGVTSEASDCVAAVT